MFARPSSPALSEVSTCCYEPLSPKEEHSHPFSPTAVEKIDQVFQVALSHLEVSQIETASECSDVSTNYYELDRAESLCEAELDNPNKVKQTELNQSSNVFSPYVGDLDEFSNAEWRKFVPFIGWKLCSFSTEIKPLKELTKTVTAKKSKENFKIYESSNGDTYRCYPKCEEQSSKASDSEAALHDKWNAELKRSRETDRSGYAYWRYSKYKEQSSKASDSEVALHDKWNAELKRSREAVRAVITDSENKATIKWYLEPTSGHLRMCNPPSLSELKKVRSEEKRSGKVITWYEATGEDNLKILYRKETQLPEQSRSFMSFKSVHSSCNATNRKVNSLWSGRSSIRW